MKDDDEEMFAIVNRIMPLLEGTSLYMEGCVLIEVVACMFARVVPLGTEGDRTLEELIESWTNDVRARAIPLRAQRLKRMKRQS